MTRLKAFRAGRLLAVGLFVAVADCGNDEHAGLAPELETVRQAVTWSPTSTLITQHVDWHTRPCSPNGQPLGGQVGVGRRCRRADGSGQGEDFLVWHRAYVERLRDDFEAKGLTHDITPWRFVMPEIKAHRFWTANAEAADQAMFTLINPSTNARFRSLDEFGTFIETSFHGILHNASAEIWSGTDSIVNGFMSPRSTLFFKIHGYIDWHMSRFLRGDFNWDGKSDLVMRNMNTGQNQILMMNDTTVSSEVTVTSVVAGAPCNWYIGATPDINSDGHSDIIWHGPGCARTVAWTMNGTTVVGTAELPAVGSDWTLIGAADFTNDLRPDLLWVNNVSRDVSYWRMNGLTVVSTPVLDVPAGWTPILVAEFGENAFVNGIGLVYRRAPAGTAEYALQYVSIGGGSLAGQVNLMGVASSMFATANAVGRYQRRGSVADLVFEAHPPAPTHGNRYFSRLSSVSGGVPSYSPATTPVEFTAAGLKIQGPR